MRERAFYLTGESYGGVYIPTLLVNIIEGNDTYPLNLQGYAIGNPLLNYDQNDDSAIFFANYHGLVDQKSVTRIYIFYYLQ